MFIFLNRLLKGFVIASWLAAAVALWSQRERARPLVDQYQLWHDVNWSQPSPLPRIDVTAVRMVGATTVQLRTPDRQLLNAGLLALDASGVPLNPAGMRWATGITTNLARRLAGRNVGFAYTLTNASRTGLGFLIVDGTNLVHEAVREGWFALKPEEARVLPVAEQYQLRLEDRAARAAGAGRWALIDPNSTTTPAPH